MPRMTKAERLAIEAKELAERQAKEAEEFLPRLMQALERATSPKLDNDFILSVREGCFSLQDRQLDTTFLIAATWSEEMQMKLLELEFELNWREAEQKEKLRLWQVKETALSKLTEEERKVLLGS